VVTKQRGKQTDFCYPHNQTDPSSWDSTCHRTPGTLCPVILSCSQCGVWPVTRPCHDLHRITILLFLQPVSLQFPTHFMASAVLFFADCHMTRRCVISSIEYGSAGRGYPNGSGKWGRGRGDYYYNYCYCIWVVTRWQ